MATGYLGKAAILYYHDGSGYVEVGACRTNSMKMNKESIDITNKSSADWKTFLEGGIKSLELSGAGVLTDDTGQAQVLAAMFAGSIKQFKLAFGNSRLIVGNFNIDSFEVEGENGKEQTFTVSLSSSGLPTLT